MDPKRFRKVKPINVAENYYGQTVSVNIEGQLVLISASVQIAIEDYDEDQRYFDDLMVVYMKILRAIAIVSTKMPDAVVELFRNNLRYIGKRNKSTNVADFDLAVH